MIRSSRFATRFAASSALVFAASHAGAQHASAAHRPDPVYEKSIRDLQAAMTSGRITSVKLVDAYVARITAYDHAGPELNAVIRLNPRARADAAALDAERKAGHVRGPMHGIPIILKDNYSTAGLATTAGTIAFAGMTTTYDAFQVKRLREAGAVIIGKSNMHELASGITTISSIGGQTCNPYDPDRAPGGSSGGSGAAVAASFAAVAWGSDTCGSIRIPSAVQNLFGLRPTKGLSSISGIVPLSHTQDVGGPLARDVRDLAIALDATVGPDPNDAATAILNGAKPASFVSALDTTSLRGVHIGVLVEHFGTESEDQEATRIVRAALDKLKARGATLVDVKIPGLDSMMNAAAVIDFEFSSDLKNFLATIPTAPVHSLAEILDDGLYDTALDVALRRRDRVGTRDAAAYRTALAARVVLRDAVVAFLDANKLDVLAYPTVRRKAALIGEPQRGSNCQLSAGSGLPALTMPAGFTPDELPIGLELLGRALSDQRLVSMAYDYEQATHPRRAPSTTPPLVDGRAPTSATWTVAMKGGGARVHGDFAFDATRRMLTYSVGITGVPASHVYVVSIDRDSAGVKGPILRRLSGEGSAAAKGSIKLADAERRELLAGHTALVVYTSDAPKGTIKAAMAVPH